MPNQVLIDRLVANGQELSLSTSSSPSPSSSGTVMVDGYLSNVVGGSANRVDLTGVSARFYLDTYNNTNTFGSSFRGRRFRGTTNNQSGVLANDVLLQLVCDGSFGSGIQNTVASMSFLASENHISGRAGTFIRLRTTPTGTTTSLERIIIMSNGDVGINNSSPQYKLDVSGAGNFKSGVYCNGVLLATTGDLSTVSGILNDKINQGGLSQAAADLLYYSITNPNGYITNSGFISNTETGQFYPSSNPQSYIRSGDAYSANNPNAYCTSGNLSSVNSSLSTSISNLNNYVDNNFALISMVDSLSGYVNDNIGGPSVSTSGLISTGDADLRYLSTGASGGFYKSSNPAGYSTSGNLENTGNAIIGLLGSYYLASNPNNYVTASIINGLSTNSNVEITGSSLNDKVNSLSGYSNSNFTLITSSNTTNSNLQSTGSVLDNRVNSLSGYSHLVFYLASNPSSYITIGDVSPTYATIVNLQSTGSSLNGKINSLSGYSNSAFATIVNLAATGQQAWSTANSNAINLSGNLQTTGSTLDNRIGSLSGYSNNSFYLKTNPDGYAQSGNFVSGISITGGLAIRGALNINAGNNITLTQQGSNTFSIASTAAGGGGGGVTGISVSGGNNLTGLFSIVQGTNIVLTQLGNTGIMIAGPAGGGEANTASNLGNGSGLFSQKSAVDLQFKSLKAGDNVIFSGTSNDLTIKCAQPFPLQFVSTAVTWTNMPLADTFFAGSVGYTQFIDLTNFTGVQLCITKAGTAGGATSMLQLKYNGNFNATVGNYLALDSNTTRSRVNVQNTFINSGYQPIVAGARSGVYVTLMGSGGDGVLDPIFGNIIAYFK